jgi:hypothetical protein
MTTIRDPEKIPNAPYTLAYAGVCLVSRYGKRADYEDMMTALDYVGDKDPEALMLIAEMFCDTKASASYSANLASARGPCTQAQVDRVAALLDLGMRRAGGHNGILVECDKISADVEPWWDE